jgi:hypothetical protein
VTACIRLSSSLERAFFARERDPRGVQVDTPLGAPLPGLGLTTEEARSDSLDALVSGRFV